MESQPQNPEFTRKVSLKILDSGITLKTFTYASPFEQIFHYLKVSPQISAQSAIPKEMLKIYFLMAVMAAILDDLMSLF